MVKMQMEHIDQMEMSQNKQASLEEQLTPLFWNGNYHPFTQGFHFHFIVLLHHHLSFLIFQGDRKFAMNEKKVFPFDTGQTVENLAKWKAPLVLLRERRPFKPQL